MKRKRVKELLLASVVLILIVSGLYFIDFYKGAQIFFKILGWVLLGSSVILSLYGLKNLSPEKAERFRAGAYQLAPLLIILAIISFIIMLKIGITQNRPSAIIFGAITSLVGLYVAFWARKKLKKGK